MKRFQFLMGFLCGALMLGGFTSVASAASGIMAALSNQAVYVDGRQISLTAYQIGGSNYVKLRDVGEAVGFNVYWDGRAVQIESDKPYTGDAPVGQTSQPIQQTTAALTEENVQATIRALRNTYPTNTPYGAPYVPIDPFNRPYTATHFLNALKESDKAITPKAWRAEVEKLTAQKDLDYQKMRAMRDDLKAVESLRRTAEQLAREGQNQHDKKLEER